MKHIDSKLFWALFGAFLFVHLIAVAQPDDVRKRRTEREPTPAADTRTAPQPATLTGVVIDDEENVPMAGVVVRISGTGLGALTDENGRFEIKRYAGDAIQLEVSSIGYEDLRVTVEPGENDVKLELTAAPLQANEIIVSASRFSERFIESPVTVEKLDPLLLESAPDLNAYETVGLLKGVDMMSSSMGFKALNSRGFNSMGNTRFVQRVDGIDLEAPGLNIQIGALNGATDLDINSIEVIPGAASALYGPNAFNGIMLVDTKSPFLHPGLSASARFGANHLSGIDHEAAPMYELTARYAHVFNDKWAFKVNVHGFRATDWYATDYQEDQEYEGSANLTAYGYERGPGNPGYDGLNRYGDEVDNLFTPSDSIAGIPLVSDPLLVARTGYEERNLSNYNTYNVKGDASVYYRIQDKYELSWTSRYAQGTSIYQAANRYTLEDFKIQSHKLELNHPNFFVLAYVSAEDAGGSYDTRFTGININQAYKPHEAWFGQYMMAFSPNTNGILNQMLTAAGRSPVEAQNDAAARAFAESNNQDLAPILAGTLLQVDPDMSEAEAQAIAQGVMAGDARYEPGAPEFERAKEQVKNNPDLTQGSLFIDKTMFYHTEGQYDFSHLLDEVDLLAGGSFRLYDLNSEGTIFSDTAGRQITNWEFGAYAQATRKFLDERLRVSAAVRYDKNENFKGQFSPRLATVLSLGENKNHNFRASVQTGFRMPTLQNQYINLNIGSFRYIAGLEDPLRPYNIIATDENGAEYNNSYTQESVMKFLNAGGTDSTMLVRADLGSITPERTQGFELGYKALFWNRLMVDLNYYYNAYQNFIVVQQLVGPDLENLGTDGAVRVSVEDVRNRDLELFSRASNISENVYAHGFGVGASYSFKKHYSLRGNYSFAEMITDRSVDEQFVIGFNTPRHKTNLILQGREIMDDWGFAVTWRWRDEMFFNESIFTGMVPAYHTVDAQISYRVPKIKTEFRLGGSNIFNQRYQQALVSPTIGSIVYLKVTFDELMR